MGSNWEFLICSEFYGPSTIIPSTVVMSHDVWTQQLIGWLINYDSQRLLDSCDGYFRLYLEISLVQISQIQFFNEITRLWILKFLKNFLNFSNLLILFKLSFIVRWKIKIFENKMSIEPKFENISDFLK